MKKAVIALLLCFASLLAFAQAPGSGAASRTATAASSQQEDESSTAEELGRVIGSLLKRAANVLVEVARGIAEGFRSTPGNSSDAEECTAEEARAGKCKPDSRRSEGPPPEKEQAQSSGFLGAFLRALF
ncbi:hypothetical protein [Caldimonas tepidiphila]|uniref:hypothetical protein n=1 Tax=Caldimonas tepidiphila TaxID=2315841 RepID=UPI000E5BD785|nr:hypothetical protein [Caldimonas tepidiphila]